MLIGPEMFFTDTSPVTMRQTIRSVNIDISQVLDRGCPTAANEPYFCNSACPARAAALASGLLAGCDADASDACARRLSLADRDRHCAARRRAGPQGRPVRFALGSTSRDQCAESRQPAGRRTSRSHRRRCRPACSAAPLRNHLSTIGRQSRPPEVETRALAAVHPAPSARLLFTGNERAVRARRRRRRARAD